MYNIKLYVSMQHDFAFSACFRFTQSCLNLYNTILLISSIDRPKQTGLFVSIRVLFISIVNTFCEKKLLYNGLVLISNNSFLPQLLQAWYFDIFLHFSYFFQKPHYSSTWENFFWNHFFHFFLSLCSNNCMVLTKFFD